MPALPALPPLSESFPATRDALQRVAVHVLARRRYDVTGRFGLRPSPAGVATPAYSVDGELEVVRTCGRLLVVERGADAVAAPLDTLAGAAALVGVDLAADFAVGGDTPPLGDPAAPLDIDVAAARAIGDWYAFGTVAVDEVVATSPQIAAATTRQVWPEHFDLAGTVTLGNGVHLNVGASPGDGYEPLPYLYLGPWDDERPGDAGYWNAPFGAVLRAGDLRGLGEHDACTRAVSFLRQGIELLHAG